MATDPNKKTLRHFQCRDYLWETFEQMSGELECSVDYLINEAMRQYARSRLGAGRSPGGAAGPSLPPSERGTNPNADALDSSPPARPSGARPPAMPSTAPPARGGASGPPRIPSLGAAPAARGGTPSSGRAMPPMPTGGRPPAMPPMPGPPPLPNNPAPRSTGGGAPPPLPGGSVASRLPPVPGGAQKPLTLYASYQGEQYPVTKEEFVIGRGQKTSDLVIRDSNVSRRHAIVVLHNGQYWIVDQQSTNGVEFHGAKIDRKRVEDGDVYRICDYEISFAYR